MGYKMKTLKLDMKKGGTFHYSMETPEGKVMWGKFDYHEVRPMEKIVFTSYFSDSRGNPVRNPMSATWPMKVMSTLTFTGHGGKTTLRLEGSPVDAGEAEIRTFIEGRESMEKGFEGTWKQLDDFLKIGRRQARPGEDFRLTRLIQAPREKVFKEWTDPARLCSWWGPKGFTNPVCEINARPGGSIRIDMKGPDGKVYPMTGEFTRIESPGMVEFQSAAMDENGKKLFETLNTIRLMEQGRDTRLTINVSVSNAAEGAEDYLKGMDEGWNQSIDRMYEDMQGD